MIPSYESVKKIVLFLITATVAALLPLSGSAAELISQVSVSEAPIDLQDGGGAQIAWQLGENALVTLFICDLDGYIVRKLYKKRAVPAGACVAGWDGRDDDGAPCPDGAYLPIIRARSSTSSQVYNPTMHAWGGRVKAEDVAYNSEQQQLTYRLDRPAICLIRSGETDGGPMYRTLLQWVPRQTGYHSEPWNGMDGRDVVYVAEKPKATIIIDAIALPPNSILVQGSSLKHRFQRGKARRVHLHPASGNDIFMHSLHERRFCRDIDIEVHVSGKFNFWKKTAKIGAAAAVSVDIPNRRHSAYIEQEGAEVYAFMDGTFISEIKIKAFPAELTIDTGAFSAGDHVLTINVRSTEDHVGTYSLPVSIAK